MRNVFSTMLFLWRRIVASLDATVREVIDFGKRTSIFLYGVIFITSGAFSLNFIPPRPIIFPTSPKVAPDERSIVVLGDVQRTSFVQIGCEQNDAEREKIVASLTNENPQAVILLGDLVFQGDSEPQWDYFDRLFAPLRGKNIPFYSVLGNHEYFGEDRIALEKFYLRFPQLEKRQWYAVTIEGIAFIMLNSNFNKLDDAQTRAQQFWYQRMLSQFEADASVHSIIVCCHHPPFTNSTSVESDESVQKHFIQPFISAQKAKIFFSGHCHAYEHFVHQGKHFFVSGGGGGPRQILKEPGSPGALRDEFPGPQKRFFHYCSITQSRGMLRIKVKGFYQAQDPLTLMDEIEIGSIPQRIEQ